MSTHTTGSPEETRDLGATFARQLKPGSVITLTGNLGSGKTQFVTGVCAGLDAHGHVASPTFTFIHEYAASFGTVVHIDLYRITNERELDELGIEEYFSDRYICLIEWPAVFAQRLPARRFDIRIEYGEADNDRVITIDERV